MSDKNEEQESSNFPRIDFVVPDWVKSLIKWTTNNYSSFN